MGRGLGRRFASLLAWCAKVAAVAVAVAILATLALLFWRVRIVTSAAVAFLPHGEGFENSFSIERVGLHGLEISDTRLGGFPAAPSFRSLKVSWTPRGLLAKRIDSVSVKGIGIDVTHRVPGFKLPSLAGAGWPAPRRDVLMGWKIGSVSASIETLDLSPLLPTNAPPKVAAVVLPAAKAGARLEFSGRYQEGRYRCGIDGSLAGFPLHGELDYNPSDASGSASLLLGVPQVGPLAEAKVEGVSAMAEFSFAEARGLDLSAKGEVRVVPCDWAVAFAARALPDGSASFSASLAGARITGDDPFARAAMLVAELIGDAALPQGLEFQGDVKAEFSLDVGNGAPRWKARAELDGVGASAQLGSMPVSVEGGRLRGSAEGCGALVAFAPCAVSFAEASAGPAKFGRSRAMILPEGKSIVVTEAAVGFCGGAIRFYSLYLDIERLAAGFTLFLDDLKMADALALFPQLEGSSATGRLYGRLPLHITPEREIRLGEGFIYTPPGETGNLSISRPEILTDFLAQAGLPAPVCANFAKALRNLDYEVFRLDLVNPRGLDGRIAVRLQGKSPDGVVVTPVNLSANINGQIEKFLNLTLKTARMATQQ